MALLDPALVSDACALGVSVPARASLPAVDTALPTEPYAPRSPATMCDPVPKRGVTLFRALVLSHLGGRDYGICRPCDIGQGPSEHYEGRAWDWRMDAANPDEAARVQALLDWLLAPGPGGEPHANFRRAGLRYLVWNRRAWSAGPKQWRPYTGPHPHTDHVHFSFDWPGARGQTSLYRWLGEPGPEPAPEPPVGWDAYAALAVGAVGGYLGAGRLMRWRA